VNTRHRLDVDGHYPTGEAACVCGARGKREEVVLHVARNHSDAVPTDVGDDFDSDATKAHYVPNEPRRPAPPTPAPPVRERATTPTIVTEVDDRAEERPRTIAESFQDMLRGAFTAGRAAAQSGEHFETWYQREVLR